MRLYPTHLVVPLIGLVTLLAVAGCMDSPELPTSVAIEPDNFGANDTSFVRITPDWGTAAGFDWQSPNEIHVARDGYMYIADERDGGRVTRMQLDGNVVARDLFATVIDTSGRMPIGLGQDSKLNLFLANGSNVIHAQNSAVERIGLASVVQTFDIIDLRTGTRHTVNNEQPVWMQIDSLVNVEGIDSIDVDFESAVSTSEADTLAGFLEPHVFVAETGGERPSEFSDVDGGGRGANTILAADQGNDRIAVYSIQPSRILELADGSTTYQFEGVYVGDAVEFGQGQVSTNNPTSVITSGSGTSFKMFFTQVDGNFLFQRLRLVGQNWQFDIPPGESGPPSIELGYFGAPVAVAAGESDDEGLGLFYVADSLQHRVTAFYPDGNVFRHVGVESELIDLEPGQALEDALTANGLEFDAALNWDLIDYVAADEVEIPVEAGESLGAAMAAEGYSFDAALNPNLSADTVYDTNLTVDVLIPTAETVEVAFPMLNTPRGVATQDGIVYIADSGNDRILRYRRSDSDSYIPNDPNL